MKTFEITLSRVEYYSQKFIVEGTTEEEAIDTAWNLSGKWRLVDAEEFTNGIEEITS